MALSEKALAFSIASLLEEDANKKDKPLSSALKLCGSYDGSDDMSLPAYWHNNNNNNNKTSHLPSSLRKGITEGPDFHQPDSINMYNNATGAQRCSSTLGINEKFSGKHSKSEPVLKTYDKDQDTLSMAIHEEQFDRGESKLKLSATRNGITVSLAEPELWTEFHKCGTEMILNRAGRRMFPCVVASVQGLDPTALYSFKMRICPADGNRYKFINNNWLPVGKADPPLANKPFEHPDSPAFGEFWMRTKISFAKVKITNNKDNLGTHTVLHSMHKYTPVIVIKREKPCKSKGEESESLYFDFEEASFIAVTAYQNEQVTQLKIQNNPFAKAFRDADVTAILQGAYMLTGSPLGAYQALYGSNVFQVGGAGSMEKRKSSAEVCTRRLKKCHSSESTIRHHYSPEKRARSSQNIGASYAFSENTTRGLHSETGGCVDIKSLSSHDLCDRYRSGDWCLYGSSSSVHQPRYQPRFKPYHGPTIRQATSTFAPERAFPLQIPRYARQLSRSTGSISCTEMGENYHAQVEGISLRSRSSGTLMMSPTWADDTSTTFQTSMEYKTKGDSCVSGNREDNDTYEPMNLAIHKDTL
ncbi:uncharacterized protein [Ptychodera flava]|uniref:uncharacterized protein n=1 Tax=Ptychodera flava TaxID=63121 RepID=UPI003969F9FA